VYADFRESKSMRRFIATILICSAWSLYAVALFLPAVRDDTDYGFGSWQGYQCIAQALNPIDWLFLPYVPLILVNFLMFWSPWIWFKAVGSRRRVFAYWFVVATTVTLTTPLLFRTVFVGGYLWTLSFACAALALSIGPASGTSDDESDLEIREPTPPSTPA
jgi:hypothetical protein